MGFKKSWKYGWVWEDETTTPGETWSWSSTQTIEQPIITDGPIRAILQGWECPKCGRVNAPWVTWCPCYDAAAANKKKPTCDNCVGDIESCYYCENGDRWKYKGWD